MVSYSMLRLLSLSANLMLVITVFTPFISSAQQSVIDVPEQAGASGDVHIVVEGNTTVPTFYSGRKEPVSGSPIHLVAIPFSDKTFSRESLQYTWNISGNRVSTTNNFLDTKAPSGKDVLVQITVRDEDGTLFAKSSKYIRLSEPFLNFYEENPLRGISYNKIKADYHLIGEEVTIRAVPFFMDTSIYSNKQTPEWRVNNEQVSNNDGDAFSITLQRSEGYKNLFLIDFQVRSAEVVTQYVQNKFNFTFDI